MPSDRSKAVRHSSVHYLLSSSGHLYMMSSLLLRFCVNVDRVNYCCLSFSQFFLYGDRMTLGMEWHYLPVEGSLPTWLTVWILGCVSCSELFLRVTTFSILLLLHINQKITKRLINVKRYPVVAIL